MSFPLIVRAAGHTRADDDGVQRLILLFFIVVFLGAVSPYPIAVWIYFNEEMHIYKHVYYSLRTFLSTPLAAVFIITGTSILMVLSMFLVYAFIFLSSGMMTIYVVSQTFWMKTMRKLW